MIKELNNDDQMPQKTLESLGLKKSEIEQLIEVVKE